MSPRLISVLVLAAAGCHYGIPPDRTHTEGGQLADDDAGGVRDAAVVPRDGGAADLGVDRTVFGVVDAAVRPTGANNQADLVGAPLPPYPDGAQPRRTLKVTLHGPMTALTATTAYLVTKSRYSREVIVPVTNGGSTVECLVEGTDYVVRDASGTNLTKPAHPSLTGSVGILSTGAYTMSCLAPGEIGYILEALDRTLSDAAASVDMQLASVTATAAPERVIPDGYNLGMRGEVTVGFVNQGSGAARLALVSDTRMVLFDDQDLPVGSWSLGGSLDPIGNLAAGARGIAATNRPYLGIAARRIRVFVGFGRADRDDVPPPAADFKVTPWPGSNNAAVIEGPPVGLGIVSAAELRKRVPVHLAEPSDTFTVEDAYVFHGTQPSALVSMAIPIVNKSKELACGIYANPLVWQDDRGMPLKASLSSLGSAVTGTIGTVPGTVDWRDDCLAPGQRGFFIDLDYFQGVADGFAAVAGFQIKLNSRPGMGPAPSKLLPTRYRIDAYQNLLVDFENRGPEPAYLSLPQFAKYMLLDDDGEPFDWGFLADSISPIGAMAVDQRGLVAGLGTRTAASSHRILVFLHYGYGR